MEQTFAAALETLLSFTKMESWETADYMTGNHSAGAPFLLASTLSAIALAIMFTFGPGVSVLQWQEMDTQSTR